jgi:hypothetical protein
MAASVAVNSQCGDGRCVFRPRAGALRWNVHPQVALTAGVDLNIDYAGYAVSPSFSVYNVSQ